MAESRVVTANNKDKIKELCLQMFALCKFNVTTLCKELRISRDIFYKLKKEDAEFAEKLEDIRMSELRQKLEFRKQIVSDAEKALYENVKEKRENSVFFALKTLEKETYSEKTQVELSTAQDMSFNIIAASKVKIESEIEDDDE